MTANQGLTPTASAVPVTVKVPASRNMMRCLVHSDVLTHESAELGSMLGVINFIILLYPTGYSSSDKLLSPFALSQRRSSIPAAWRVGRSPCTCLLYLHLRSSRRALRPSFRRANPGDRSQVAVAGPIGVGRRRPEVVGSTWSQPGWADCRTTALVPEPALAGGWWLRR